MSALVKRLEALEARAALTAADSEQTAAAAAEFWNILERYAAIENPTLEGASPMMLVAQGHYEEVLARCDTEEDALYMTRLILTWEARRRGVTFDEVLDEAIEAATKREAAT